MKTDSGEKAAVKKSPDYSEVDVCTNSAVRYASKVQSRYVYYIAVDSLKSSSFTVLNMKTQSVSLLVRITAWFSVIEQLCKIFY